MIDPQQLGRAPVHGHLPLGIPGVGQHQQPIGGGLGLDLDPGLGSVADLDGRRLANNGSPPSWLSSQVGRNPPRNNPANPCFSGPKNPSNTSSKKVSPRARIAARNGTVSSPKAR
jgi:hypothetical protein